MHDRVVHELIEEAARLLREGGVVVLPTDTVYGIGCLPDRAGAVQAVFELKGRPDDKPLPVLGASVDELARVATFDDAARAVAHRFWPGPLTLVLPRAEGFTFDLGGEGDGSVAVRVPESELALTLLEEVGPLAVTSANRSGERPATRVDDARRLFGERVGAYLDEGVCDGLPSTVASLVDGLRVLRPGPVTEDQLRQIVTS